MASGFGKALVATVIVLISILVPYGHSYPSRRNVTANTSRSGRARLGGPKQFQQGQCGWGKVIPGESDRNRMRNGRIVGGFPAKSPIPWQVSLQEEESPGRWKHICGAALISQFLVLTASHCINSISAEAKYRVVVSFVRHDFCLNRINI
jgi:hypothetical protein